MNQNILPQGDYIRQLLVKSNISISNINILLRDKGVFLGHNEKNNSVPLLMKSIISPNDYKELYDTQKSKEERVKYKTSSIKCKLDFDLTDLLGARIDLNALIIDKHTYKPNFKVIGTPSFFFESENIGHFEYTIERENALNDWTNNTTFHKGAITFNKISEEEVQISVQENSTSKETVEVNNIVMSILKERMNSKSIISSSNDIISVKFNHFDNLSRVKFFNSFTGNFHDSLDFTSITDIDLYLDENVVSHKDVKIFLDEIDNLKLSGKGLQNHMLLTDDKYYSKLIFGAIKLRYKVNYAGVKGSVLINLGFQEYVKNKNENSDFEISIDIVLNKEFKNEKNINTIRKKFLEIFEKKKVESYDEFKIV
ncbi:GapS4b family protein [Polaribacter glomeratus]|uniref:GAPS4b N-terminal domain-containing protein n=1 Tax=Polaribacter glomeratus TaxID=102 RepID=A0A2S7WYW3_9FLAO|nr:hypothetical protein [Polaribacter glomeratus]PQJ82784.1 hypothetical protein BTO16_09425 [Polaribacter glomeratus]TXD65326.1 hypothetical protein ESX12_10905 [Polaribacter glomeratus]